MKMLLSLFFLVSVFACQQEKIVIPDTGRKIVINSLLATDSLIGLNLSGSLYLNDTLAVFNSNNVIENATAVIYENGNYLDSLQYTKFYSLGDFFLVPNNYHSKTFFPKPGNQYKIIVNAPGKPEATAVTTIPNLVKIEKVDTSRVILTDVGSRKSNVNMVCDVIFTDPGNEKNFYLFYVFGGETSAQGTYNGIMYGDNGDLTFQDPIVEEELDHGSEPFGIAFSDKSINGKQHRISVTINGNYSFWDDNSPFPAYRRVLYFRLYSITEEYFKYIQTLNLFFKNYNNPLASPTQVFTNIQGGYGIFAGAAVSSDSIVFTK